MNTVYLIRSKSVGALPYVAVFESLADAKIAMEKLDNRGIASQFYSIETMTVIPAGRAEELLS